MELEENSIELTPKDQGHLDKLLHLMSTEPRRSLLDELGEDPLKGNTKELAVPDLVIDGKPVKAFEGVFLKKFVEDLLPNDSQSPFKRSGFLDLFDFDTTSLISGIANSSKNSMPEDKLKKIFKNLATYRNTSQFQLLLAFFQYCHSRQLPLRIFDRDSKKLQKAINDMEVYKRFFLEQQNLGRNSDEILQMWEQLRKRKTYQKFVGSFILMAFLSLFVVHALNDTNVNKKETSVVQQQSQHHKNLYIVEKAEKLLQDNKFRQAILMTLEVFPVATEINESFIRKDYIQRAMAVLKGTANEYVVTNQLSFEKPIAQFNVSSDERLLAFSLGAEPRLLFDNELSENSDANTAPQTLSLWNLDTGEEIFSASTRFSFLSSIAFSQDHSMILAVSNGSGIELFDTLSGESILYHETKADIRQAQLSEDGTILIASTAAGAVEVYSIKKLGDENKYTLQSLKRWSDASYRFNKHRSIAWLVDNDGLKKLSLTQKKYNIENTWGIPEYQDVHIDDLGQYFLGVTKSGEIKTGLVQEKSFLETTYNSSEIHIDVAALTVDWNSIGQAFVLNDWKNTVALNPVSGAITKYNLGSESLAVLSADSTKLYNIDHSLLNPNVNPITDLFDHRKHVLDNSPSGFKEPIHTPSLIFENFYPYEQNIKFIDKPNSIFILKKGAIIQFQRVPPVPAQNALSSSNTDMNCFNFSQDSTMIAGCMGFEKLGVWNISTGQLVNVQQASKWMSSVDFNHDKTQILTLSGTDTAMIVELWDVPNRGLLKKIVVDACSWDIHTSLFSSDDNTLFSNDGKNLLVACISIDENLNSALRIEEYSTTGATTADEWIFPLQLIDKAVETHTSTLPIKELKSRYRNLGNIFNLASSDILFSGDAERHITEELTGDIEKKLLKLIDSTSGKFVNAKVVDSDVYMLSFSNNHELLSVHADGNIELWDTKTLELNKRFSFPLEGGNDAVFPPSFSKHDKYILLSSTKKIELWDLANDILLFEYHSNENTIGRVKLSPDNNYVAWNEGDYAPIHSQNRGILKVAPVALEDGEPSVYPAKVKEIIQYYRELPIPPLTSDERNNLKLH